jgi:predicted O-methyltransferase YrrM
MMDAAVEKILHEFEERSAREWEQMKTMEASAQQRRLDDFLLFVGPATGRLMNLLTKEAKSKIILEVGSSYGYSTVWLAEAARETGGKVISLEIHAEKQRQARTAIQTAGLDGFVDFRLGDARESLRNMPESVDFVLVDLWKDLYISCFDLFYPKLRPGALIVADNMILPESAREHAEAYRRHVRAKAGIESVLLNVGHGIELSRYK